MEIEDKCRVNYKISKLLPIQFFQLLHSAKGNPADDQVHHFIRVI
jgi:hypothetical protein